MKVAAAAVSASAPQSSLSVSSPFFPPLSLHRLRPFPVFPRDIVDAFEDRIDIPLSLSLSLFPFLLCRISSLVPAALWTGGRWIVGPPSNPLMAQIAVPSSPLLNFVVQLQRPLSKHVISLMAALGPPLESEPKLPFSFWISGCIARARMAAVAIVGPWFVMGYEAR